MQRSIKAPEVVVLWSLLAVQSHASSPTAPGYEPPRQSDGRPSLEGTWTNATLTSLQRPERGSAGPPMMTYLYNNNYEIVQTRDAVAIRAEMNNYALEGTLRGAREEEKRAAPPNGR